MLPFKIRNKKDMFGTSEIIFPNGSMREATPTEVLLYEILKKLNKK